MTRIYNILFFNKGLVLLCCFAFLLCTNLYAIKTDSLKVLIQNKKIADTTKVNLLLELAGYYQDISLDSMDSYLYEAMAVADSAKFEIGKAKACHKLGLTFLFKNESDSSLKYYQAAIDIYQRNGILKPQGNAYLSIADIFLKQKKYLQAIEYYNKGNAICEQVKNYIGKGFGLMSIGGVYLEMGNYAESINYFLQSLTPFNKEKYNVGYCIGLTNIATVFSTMQNYPKAMEYIRKSDAVNLPDATNEQKLYIIYNTSTVYGAMKEYEKALAGFRKALDLASSIGDDSWRCSCIVNIADMFAGLGNFDSALINYNEALRINKKINDPLVQISGEMGKGRILITRGNKTEGLKKMQDAFDIAFKNKIKQSVFDVAKELSVVFDSCKNYSLALKYHKIFTVFKDSVHNDKNNIRIQQLQFDYELGRKESQIELLHKKKAIAHGVAERQSMVLKILLFSSIGMVLVVVLLFRSRKAEQVSKREMELQKEEIEIQAEKLKELNYFKDKTFSVLSHDLRGPINAFARVLNLIERNSLTDKDFEDLRAALSSQTKSLTILLEDLLNWARLYMKGKGNQSDSCVNLFELTECSILLLKDVAVDKSVKIINNIPTNISVWCDREQLNIVIRNILSNSIKFSNAGSTVCLSATTSTSYVSLKITDQGIGMTQSQIDQLFDWTHNNTSMGTVGERGIGLGMKLCMEFIKSLNGTIKVNSEIGKGTIITVDLPIF